MISQTDNIHDKEKLQALKNAGVHQVIDTSVTDFDATRKFAVRYTPADRLPAFAALATLLATHGKCRLCHFDELSAAFNMAAVESNYPQIDCEPRRILGGLFVLFDVATFNDKTQELVKNINVTSDWQWWKQNILCHVQQQELLDKMYNIAKQIKMTTLIY